MSNVWNELALGSPFLTYQDAPNRFNSNWNNAWNQPYAANSRIGGTQPGYGLDQLELGTSTGGAPNRILSGTSFLGGVPTGGLATGATPAINPVVTGLLTPGLVPDIARQSAEVSAGRGVGQSPAASSTAVRMSEQDYLQRLALANTLLTGESQRTLPYQITPYQQRVLDLQQAEISSRLLPAMLGKNLGFGGGSGGGGYGGGGVGGARQPAGPTYPFGNTDFGTLSAPGVPRYGGSSGPAGLGSNAGQWTLDDAYDWLGFGNFGSQAGDVSSGFPEFQTPVPPADDLDLLG